MKGCCVLLFAICLVCCLISPQTVFAASGYRIIIQADGEPNKFLSDLGNGYYTIQSFDDQKVGICASSGKIIIPAVYDYFWDYFENGTIIVSNGRFKGLLDIRKAAAGGNYELLPIKYLDFSYISDNRYIVRTDKDQWGVVDRTDKLVAGYLPAGYKVEWDDLYQKIDGEKIALNLKLAKLLRVRANGKYGLMDTSLNIAVPIEYEYLDILGQNSVVAVQNDKYGLIDASGNTLIPIQYRFIVRVNDNAYILYSDDGCEVFDISAKTVLIPRRYDELIPVTGNLLMAKINGKYGAVDLSGKQIEPFIYDEMLPVDVPENISGYLHRPVNANYKAMPEITSYLSTKVRNYWFCNTDIFNTPRGVYKLLYVAKGGKQYLIDPEKQMAATSDGYDQISYWCGYGGSSVINKDAVIVKNGDMFGLIDLSGRVLIPFLYSTIQIPYTNPLNYSGLNYIFVYRDGKYAVLNLNNQTVTPFKEYPEAPNHGPLNNYIVSSQNGLIKELIAGSTSGNDDFDYEKVMFDPPIPDVTDARAFGSLPFDSKDGLLYQANYKEKPALISFNGDVPKWTGLELAAGSACYYKYGVKYSASNKSYISDSGRLMIPLSSVAAMFDVKVINAKSLVTLSKYNTSLIVSADGKPPHNKAEVIQRGAELYISCRDLADYFGYTIIWEPEGNKAKIHTW